jgi:hypothetical protein
VQGGAESKKSRLSGGLSAIRLDRLDPAGSSSGKFDQRRLFFDFLGLKFPGFLRWSYVLHVISSEITISRSSREANHGTENAGCQPSGSEKAASKGGP